jgi:hypothetical protein
VRGQALLVLLVLLVLLPTPPPHQGQPPLRGGTAAPDVRVFEQIQ